MRMIKAVPLMIGAITLPLASLLYLIIGMADRTLILYGERDATGWANYIGARLTNLEDTAASGRLTDQDREFLEGVLQFGEVFHYKIFDRSGRLVLMSDPPLSQAIDPEFALHNMAALDVLAAGQTSIEVKDGKAKPPWPDVYVESYVPLMRDGHMVAIVEVYIDQTAAAAALNGQYLGFGLSIIGLTLLALSIPAIALVLTLRQLRSRNAALVVEREHARKAERAKSDFLARMSHEIRTPMNGVMGMVELLAGSSLSERQNLFVDIIRKSADLLLGVINDILDFSKIDAGRMTLDLHPFELARIAEEPAQLVAHAAHVRRLELVVRVQPSLPGHVTGDFGRICQIVTNLLGNAVKFTNQGEIVVDVSGETRVEAGLPLLALRVEVRDTGVGIAPAMQRKVFEEFAQVDGSTTRRHQGTGLGLSICRALVELMDGEIGVDSAAGRGSNFWFTIALPVAEPSTEEAGAAAEFAGRRVLIVDDNASSRAALEELLTAWGIDPTVAASGPDALHCLMSAAVDGRGFDAVLLDWQMPGMDGAEVLQSIRSAPASAGTPVLLMTPIEDGAADGGQISGAEIRIVKPVAIAELRAGLRAALGREAKAVAAPAAPEREPSPPETAEDRRVDVLIVEDNEVNLILVQQTLIGAGLSHRAAREGAEALELYRRCAPRLILMDVSMPVMDGYAATRHIRAIEAELNLRRTPIIGLTAHSLNSDRNKCLAAGMDDYITKPFSTAQLVEILRSWIAGEAPDVILG